MGNRKSYVCTICRDQRGKRNAYFELEDLRKHKERMHGNQVRR